ncbi:MAG: HD domain-containing protein [Bacillota bacterium]|jgi:putative hydrolase of HD superfamily|nr:HD domain-containing protein [Bacillota bacterium]NLV62259.1 HD domain-containing protein [Clostridiaceae bacterium]
MDRLKKQISFIIETDKLKTIYRQSLISDKSRYENDAEHSWHLALMAVLLSEHTNEQVDLLKVIKMVIIHDIVEIDAGDTYCYDEKAKLDKREREEKCANRIFSLLPDDQRDEMFELWEEFEKMETAEAKFAAALDRLQPVLLNYTADGMSWKKHGISKKQVIERNRLMKDGSDKLWDYAKQIIEDAVKKGYVKE